LANHQFCQPTTILALGGLVHLLAKCLKGCVSDRLWRLNGDDYCLAVPANRYGSAVYNPAQLKTMQEVITFAVFAGFSNMYLQEPITLGQGFGFALIAVMKFRRNVISSGQCAGFARMRYR